MTDSTILTQLPLWADPQLPPKKSVHPRTLHLHWDNPARLPAWVTACPTLMRCRALLGLLDWHEFPERNLARFYGHTTIPYATRAAAELVRLNEGIVSMTKLQTFLKEHPAFIWLLGFALVPAPKEACGFNARASLPTERHLAHSLRTLPNAALQFLLADSVRLILTALQQRKVTQVECVALDTKHILAWVKENNPKAYVTDRYDKTNQPKAIPIVVWAANASATKHLHPQLPRTNPLVHTRQVWANSIGAMVRVSS